MRKRETALLPGSGKELGEERDPQFVTALARGLEILRAFRRGDPPLGNQEIARRTGLPKATVSRLTYTLGVLGYLKYSPDDSRYSLSTAALALGFSALGSVAVRDIARPYMQSLADETGVSVALGARDGKSMVYLEHCRGDSPLHMGIEVGSHIKMATSAMGRAYLAALPQAERDQFLERLKADPVSWPKLRDGISQAVQDLSERGFVLSIGEWKEQVNAVGVPLALGTGTLLFALNCGGPAIILTREQLVERVGPRLVEIAKAIIADMNGLQASA
ncbi:DNA-binding IclR family transcriptional regulator [Microvirga flocculans]|uniref:DNA-binding IclR family transcriptional regulator n=1 Tax=Microvirga flocculans TaxID=217168 RepID=A0A7W6N8I6_9HYPH|nr:IclR family transcriptional regulator [Microvirga flocculans]MBB4040470.1 DNA-binding IclR family transcriptional regulator [Microvirga flocculans]